MDLGVDGHDIDRGRVVLTIVASIPRSISSIPSDTECLTDGPSDSGLTSADVSSALHYSRAQIRLSDARNDDDYQNAINELACVVKLQPDSVMAQLDFARAAALRSRFLTEQSYVKLPSKGALSSVNEGTSAALTALRETGNEEPPRLLNSLGRNTLLLAIGSKDSDRIKLSIEYLERARQSVAGAEEPSARRLSQGF